MKLIYISKAFDGNIGATLHYKALKELYGEENIFTYDLRPIVAHYEENYSCPGKYKNHIDRIQRWMQGNMMFISNSIITDICKTIKERNIKIVFIEDSVFGNLVKKVKQKFPKVQVVTFYHDIKADLYPQWMKKERNIISEIEFRIGIKQEALNQKVDLPARSGLGTSSSFAVGMLNAFYALKGKYADKKKLADEAIYLERNLCQEAGGWQDQIAASFGGFNRINFNADGYEVLPVIISPERKKQLNQNLMMFFTGFTRFSSDVQKANAAGKQDKIAQLKEMLALVDDAERVLTDKNADLDDFGRMLDHTWKLKRQTGAAVSTNSIDELYAKGMAAGALGGKLLGAGGGGFLVFYVQPERQDSVRWAMRDLMHIPFAFEDGGTRVIHYTPETYIPKE